MVASCCIITAPECWPKDCGVPVDVWRDNVVFWEIALIYFYECTTGFHRNGMTVLSRKDKQICTCSGRMYHLKSASVKNCSQKGKKILHPLIILLHPQILQNQSTKKIIPFILSTSKTSVLQHPKPSQSTRRPQCNGPWPRGLRVENHHG